MAEKMGGEEKVARQHSRGKMDARARLAAIVDPGSFREIGKIAGRGAYGPDGTLEDLAASNFIFGRANIDGRPVVASADTPNEKLQNDALNGCDRYHGIRRSINRSCNRP